MKLNLLPKQVTRANSSRNALVGASVFALAAVAASVFFLILGPKAARDKAKQEAEDAKPAADAVVARAAEADTLAATTGDLVKNVDLSNAMVQHNVKVTQFYRSMFQYIPSFYRINTMNYVADADGGGVTLQLTGTLQTEQQYTDLMLALLRIPGAQSVARGGYTRNALYLPNVTEANPNPSRILENETPLPVDGYAKMNELISRAAQAPTGFQNIGNYGGAETDARGAIPDWHLVNVNVVLKNPTTAVPVPAPGAAGAPGAPGTAPAPGGAGGPGGPAAGQKPAAPAAPAAAAVPAVNYDLRVPDPSSTLGVQAMSGGGNTGGGGGIGAGGGFGGPGGVPRKKVGIGL